ncbi:hypothetical protein ACWGNM_31680 [Streptomyces sp. NPDC055796]
MPKRLHATEADAIARVVAAWLNAGPGANALMTSTGTVHTARPGAAGPVPACMTDRAAEGLRILLRTGRTEEHEAEDISYQMVRRYVADRKSEILAASGKAPVEAFAPQSHQLGMEAEVDFGDVNVLLASEPVTCYMFSFRPSYSGKAVHPVFASCGQQAFFEGQMHALRTLGGVPRTKVRYGNLKSAVAQVLGLGRARVETGCWMPSVPITR